MTSDRPKPAPADPKRPYHVGVAIGVTTGAYALSLLAASTLQIQHDQALIVDRQPMAAAIDVLGSTHDEMETRLEAARARYADGTDGYGALIARLDKMRNRLAKMGQTVAGIEQDSGWLAASVPGTGGLSRGVTRSTGSTTSRSTGGSSTGSVATAPRSVPAAPAAAAPPPVSSTTAASGKP